MIKDIERILISREELEAKIKDLGLQITEEYKGKDLVLICVLKGAVMFITELAKNINLNLEMDFMAISSYGASTKSSGVVKIIKDLDTSIEGRDILIVEDIIDSGLTLKYLIENLKSRDPKSIKICTLLDKPDGRQVEVDVDYTGFEVPNEFVVGFGLDFAEKYRNLPYIGILKEEIYK
ncbi:hypoxanthine phosphoribosyltransferase [Abyssisolibacter fermentans]|uniref:hypoxanthine phosphoribosyltransferase n=1 Tax=Abyssisolibacter fermentans TaxID=1766203 RepID=UPI00082E3941|nr:hypoxanthine phosphoribosyltransferase [Abyssisolibacter fermentans]